MIDINRQSFIFVRLIIPVVEIESSEFFAKYASSNRVFDIFFFLWLAGQPNWRCNVYGAVAKKR